MCYDYKMSRLQSTPDALRKDYEEVMGVTIPGNPFSRKNMPIVAGVTAVSLTRLGPVIDPSLDPRGHLPEPVDFPNHVGNMAVTFVMTAHFASAFNGKQMTADTPESFKKKSRMLAGAIGTITVGANLFGELVGYGSISTPDPYDFAYGLAGGMLAYKLSKSTYIEPDIASEIRKNSPADSRSKQILDKVLAPHDPKPAKKLNRKKSKSLRR